MAIYPGNQTMEKGEYLDISRASDREPELTPISGDPTSTRERTNKWR